MTDANTRRSNVDKAHLQNVIVIDSVVGRGTEDDPVRTIREYWSLEGELLARRDHWRERQGQRGEPNQTTPGISEPES